MIAESATLKVGNEPTCDEVDDRAAQEPRRAEQAVDQVAERAAEDQRQRHDDQRVVGAAHRAHEEHGDARSRRARAAA